MTCYWSLKLLLSQAAAEILRKDFAFPKMHTLLVHAIEDIRRKGPLRDSNTILGEAGHPIFKKDFAHTDGRDTDPQVNHYCFAFHLTNMQFLDCETSGNTDNPSQNSPKC